ALKSGLSRETTIPKVFTQPHLTPKTKTPVKISLGLLSTQSAKQVTDVENTIKRGYTAGVKRTAKILASSIGANMSLDKSQLEKIINNAGFYSVIGAGLEAAIGMIGAPFFEKTETTKAIDFPMGIGKASALFGNFPSNIPTDVTRTAGGFGKGISGILSQAERYLEAQKEGLYDPKQPKGISKDLFGELDSILTPDRAKTVSEITGLTVTAKQLRSKNQRASTLERIRNNISSDTASRLFSAINPNKPMGSPGSIPTRRAFGGNISGQDTVPALLTPGEFVINKNAAQRIGSAGLHKLNNADKIQGYNKGVFVGIQKFINGGEASRATRERIISRWGQPFNPTFSERASSRALAYQNRADSLGISARGDLNAIMASFNRGLANTAKALNALSTSSNYTSTNIKSLGMSAPSLLRVPLN
ncbi:MAG: hypothetical protein ACKO7N_08085, partial [Candidatus Nitrosotenuis sp.]